MMVGVLHADEYRIDERLVRTLVASAAPQWLRRPLTPLPAFGSSNVLFRLGDDLLVRLPRQPGGGNAIVKEARWLPELAAHLRVSTPRVALLVAPGEQFPEYWSVLRWLPGTAPPIRRSADAEPLQQTGLAVDLADAVQVLRRIPVTDAALTDPSLRGYRGRPLAEFSDTMHDYLDWCARHSMPGLDVDRAHALWTEALELPGAQSPTESCWYHGDLVAENLLLRDGRLSAILDFGGLGIGDPAVDLHGAWELFEADDRSLFRTRLGVSDAEWLRGRAWALAIALGVLAYYGSDMPGRSARRLLMAQSVLEDF